MSSSSTSPSPILYESICHKQGQQWKSWKPRLFRISRDYFSYHQPNGAHKLIKQYDVNREVHAVRMLEVGSDSSENLLESSNSPDDTKRKFLFEVILDNRILKISAPSQKERLKWVQVIRKVLKMKNQDLDTSTEEMDDGAGDLKKQSPSSPSQNQAENNTTTLDEDNDTEDSTTKQKNTAKSDVVRFDSSSDEEEDDDDDKTDASTAAQSQKQRSPKDSASQNPSSASPSIVPKIETVEASDEEDDDDSEVSTESDDLQDVDVKEVESRKRASTTWKEDAKKLRQQRSPRFNSTYLKSNPFSKFAVRKQNRTVIASNKSQTQLDEIPDSSTKQSEHQDDDSPADSQKLNSDEDAFAFFDSDGDTTPKRDTEKQDARRETNTEMTSALSTDGSSDDEFDQPRQTSDEEDEKFFQNIEEQDVQPTSRSNSVNSTTNLVFSNNSGIDASDGAESITFLANRGKTIDLHKQILFSKEDMELIMNPKSPLIDGVQRQPGTLLIKQIRDNRNIQNDFSYNAIMQVKGDNKVLWSGRVLKINQKLKHFKRVMVVNMSGLLILYKNKRGDDNGGGSNTPGTPGARKAKYTFKKWIPFSEISHVCYSDEERQSLLAAILLPGRHKDILLEFPSKLLKQEFLEHIEDVFHAVEGKSLNLMEVVDVKLPVRFNRGEKITEPVPLSEDQKLISHETDQFNLADDPKWRSRLRKFGDRHVYFSETVEKVKTTSVKHLKIKAKRMFIITDRAVYNCKQDTTVKRRIELSDITELLFEERNSRSLLFVVPTETKERIKSYDLYIKFKTSLDAHRKRKTVRDILVHLIPGLQVNSARDIKYNHANLTKTVEYRAMLKKRMDPQVVKAQLKQAIISKDEGILEKAVETAKRIDMESDKYYCVAVKELQRIRDSAAIKKQWEQAMQTQDVKGMKYLFEKAEKLKPHMTQFVQQVAPKYMRLVNEKIFVKKMEMALESRDTKAIKQIFAKASMAGLHEQVNYFQRQYYALVQREYTSNIIEKLIESNDVDSLRLVIKNSESFMNTGREEDSTAIAEDLSKVDDDATEMHTLSRSDSVSSMIPADTDVIRSNQELLHYAKQFVRENRDMERARKKLFKRVHEACEKGDPRIIQQAIEEARSSYPTLETATNAIQTAQNTIQEIEKRKKQSQELQSAIQQKDKRKLEKLISLTQEDEYLEKLVHQAEETLNILHGGEKEVKRLEQVRQLKTSFRETFKVFNHSDKGDLSALKELVAESKQHPELVNQIKAAESLISNLEQKRREENLLAHEDHDMTDALDKNDMHSGGKLVDICSEEAEKFAVAFFESGTTIFVNDRHSAQEETLEMERLIREKIESKDIVEIKRVLMDAQNYPGLDDTMQLAVEAIDKIEYNQQLGEKLDQLIVGGNREELSQFISENKESMDDNLLRRARNAWKDIWDEEQKIAELKEMLTSLLKSASYTKKDILERAIRKAEPYAVKDESLMRLVDLLLGTLNGDDDHMKGKQHHLIQILYESIVKLLRSYKKGSIGSTPTPFTPVTSNGDSATHYEDGSQPPIEDGKLIVRLTNPFGQTVVRNLNNIFSAHTTRYWFKERKTWDIFKGIRHSVIQNAVREFESFDAIKTLPSDDFSTTASLLFIQYMLDRGYFRFCIKEFLDDAQYLSECYLEQSLLRDENHREALRGVLTLLDQFKFQYGFEHDENIRAATQYSADYIISHPVSEIKDAVQEIVQYFFINSSAGTAREDLELLGDDTKNIEIALLVRDKLCRPLLKAFEHGFKKGVFATASVWSFIESVAEEKEDCALDLGGIGLPQAVLTVNEMVKNYDEGKDMQAAELAEIKFKCFVCYGLNDRQLGEFVRSLIRSKGMMKSYYETNALLCRENIQQQLVSILQKLNPLPFQLHPLM